MTAIDVILSLQGVLVIIENLNGKKTLTTLNTMACRIILILVLSIIHRSYAVDCPYQSDCGCPTSAPSSTPCDIKLNHTPIDHII